MPCVGKLEAEENKVLRHCVSSSVPSYQGRSVAAYILLFFSDDNMAGVHIAGSMLCF